jgi:hypothetical protein
MSENKNGEDVTKLADHVAEVRECLERLYDVLGDEDLLIGLINIAKNDKNNCNAILSCNMQRTLDIVRTAVQTIGDDDIDFLTRARWYDAMLGAVYHLTCVDVRFANCFYHMAQRMMNGSDKLIHYNEQTKTWENLDGYWPKELLEYSNTDIRELKKSSEEFVKSLIAAKDEKK